MLSVGGNGHVKVFFVFFFFTFVKNVKYIEICIVRFHFIWNFSDFTSDEKIC